MKREIMKGFWEKLPKSFFILAPMADVTDAVFRKLMSERSKPDVMYTEFVSADGLCSPGRKNLLVDLEYGESERPIVAQLFSSHPQKMKEASALCAKLQFDGIDINMGCPDRSIEKQGAGAMMIKTPETAREIIRAAKEGAPDLPISVKTRLGYNSDVLEEWLQVLLEENLSAITIHARTRKDISKVPARWERVKRAVEIRELSGKETLIIGNGDVRSLEEGRKISQETGCDGIMIGRGIFWNPWMFANLPHLRDGWQIERPVSILPKAFSNNNDRDKKLDSFVTQSRNRPKPDTSGEYDTENPSRKIEMGYIPTIKERLLVAVEHTKRFEKRFDGIKSFAVMKKHFKAYVEGFPGAKDLRVKLMEAKNSKEVEMVIKNFLEEEKIL